MSNSSSIRDKETDEQSEEQTDDEIQSIDDGMENENGKCSENNELQSEILVASFIPLNVAVNAENQAPTSTTRMRQQDLLVRNATEALRNLRLYLDEEQSSNKNDKDNLVKQMRDSESDFAKEHRLLNERLSAALDEKGEKTPSGKEVSKAENSDNFFKKLFDLKGNKEESRRLVEDFADAVDSVLNRNDLGQIWSRSDTCFTDNTFFFTLLDQTSPVRENISLLNSLRVPMAIPTLPSTIREAEIGVTKLTIACWNVGGCSNLDKAVFIVLMHLLKVDIILVQERKAMKLEDLWEHQEYSELYFQADITTFTSKRGISIWYRNEIKEKICKPDGKVDRACLHTTNGKSGGGGDAEYLWLDVKMTPQATMRRIVNVYHVPQANLDCIGNISNVLKPTCSSDIRTLIMGDVNMEARIGPLENKLREELRFQIKYKNNRKGKVDVENVLHRDWKTHHKEDLTSTQPDVIFSNIGQEDLVIHKPIDPFDMVKDVILKLSHGNNTAVKEIVRLNKQYYKEKMRKAKDERKIKNLIPPVDDPVRKPGEYHYILMTEVGSGINNGTFYDCCWEAKTKRKPARGKYYCSKDNCNFLKKALEEMEKNM